jgi:phosphosulfolactate phosphohydrolase-like enzyme
MTTRHLLVSSLAALALAAAPALHATPLRLTTPIHASYAKEKAVSISFRNDTASPLELKVGESLMKVEAGKTLALHLPVGTKVIANTATPNLPAGSVIAEVATYLSGATLSIK